MEIRKRMVIRNSGKKRIWNSGTQEGEGGAIRNSGNQEDAEEEEKVYRKKAQKAHE